MQVTSGNVNINLQDVRKSMNRCIPNMVTAGTLLTASVPAGRFIWAPMLIGSNDQIISRVGVNVSIAASAGKKARFGVYTNEPGRVFGPDKLLYDLGEVGIDNTGWRSIDVQAVLGDYMYLPRNSLFWFCFALEEAATLYYKPTAHLLCIAVDPSAPTTPSTSWRHSRAYALGMPSDASSLAALSDDGGFILLGVL